VFDEKQREKGNSRNIERVIIPTFSLVFIIITSVIIPIIIIIIILIIIKLFLVTIVIITIKKHRHPSSPTEVSRFRGALLQ
jgi:hypothetical protein